MTTDTQLLPCPFCGANAHFEMDDARWEWVECESCGMQGNRRTSLMEDCKPMLAAAWNTRAGGEPEAWCHREHKHIIWHRPVDAEVANWQPHYTAPQPVERKPLPDSWIRSMCAQPWVFDTVKQWVRITEDAHGIKGGDQKSGIRLGVIPREVRVRLIVLMGDSICNHEFSAELLNSATNPAGVLTLALLRGVEQVVAQEDGNNARKL